MQNLSGEDIKDRDEALHAALSIYRLAETRSMVPQGLPSDDRPSSLEDYTASKRSKSEIMSLYRQAKTL